MNVPRARVPHNRSSQPNRRDLPLLLCAAALLLGATAGHTQWLETKITLPDSLGGAVWPTCLTADTSERYVYIGDVGGAVYVVDTKARTRVAKIPSGYVSAVCTDTRHNKVYAADHDRNRVLVISCATNQVVATVPTGARPFAVCYNSIDDKVYAANYVYGKPCSLTVIDCLSDSAVATMHLGQGQPSLCYNPAGNRVFCWTQDTLMVIDGASDSIAASYAGTWSGSMVVNAVANKVYINALALDGTTGAVLDTLNGLGSVMCLNPRTQKLYCVDDNPVYMYVFDCTADTLVARIRPLHVESVFSIACDTLTNRVYAAASASSTPRDVILVIDGDADTIAARIAGPAQGRLLASTKRGRVYAADLGGPELAVFDTGTDRLLRTILIGGESRLMCYDSIDAKVYYVTPSLLGEASAIDAATNQPVGHVQVGQYARSVIWHTPTNRVYVGGRQDITVIDPTTDIVAKVLAVRGYLLCSAPRQNKVYAISGPFELSVIDCRNDSVTKTIVIPTYGALSMCYVAYDKLYIGGEGTGALSIIDCVGDTLIRSYPFGYTVLAAGREGQQVYCAQTFSLCTFDAAGDTLVAEVPWVASGGGDLLYVPSADKIYYACLAGGQDCILVADGRTDSVIAEIPLHLPASLGNESTNGLVYCGQELYDSAVTFINNRTDSVVGSQITGLTATTFVTVPAHNRVYVGGYGKSFIPVIRTDLPGVEEAAQPRTKNEVRPAIVSRNSPLIAHQPSILLDAAGRKVLELLPGPNHVRGLAPGVYFVRQQGSRGQGFEDSRVTKVVMTR